MIVMKVRPAVQHPLFFETQYGRLCVWLFASSDDDAADRAIAIVERLPYELVGDGATVYRDSNNNDAALPPEVRPNIERCRQQLREAGLSVFWFAAPVGADEGMFLEDE